MTTVPLASTLDRLQRRHPVAGFPLAVVYKYSDDQGGYLAALITYYGFVSIFPLLLVLSTALSVVLVGDPHAQQQVLHSALSEFPVIGSQLQDPRHLGGGTAGLVIGLVGALYGGLGVAQATQNAMNTVWRVPRNDRPNPFASRARSLLIVLSVGLTLLGTTALTAASGTGSRGLAIHLGGLAASVLMNAVALVLTFRFATARALSVGEVAPGAVLAAVGWQLLQTFGATYVEHVVKNASATNSVFALVLGLIAFVYVAAVILVFCLEINAVRVDRLYPRALLTPFTDDVSLTSEDERSYAAQAKAQRSKGFEDIDVTFNPHVESADEDRARPAARTGPGSRSARDR